MKTYWWPLCFIVLIVFLGVFPFFYYKKVFAQSPSGFRFIAWADTKTGTTTLAKLSTQLHSFNPVFTIYAGDSTDTCFDQTKASTFQRAINGNTSGTTSNGIFNITFPVRGNHEVTSCTTSYTQAQATAFWQSFFSASSVAQTIGATHYTPMSTSTDNLSYYFDYGNARFIGLDVLGGSNNLTTAQINWLDQVLTDAETNYPNLIHAFLFFHGPVYSVDGHPESIAPDVFITLVTNKHPIVSAVFNGHEHVYAYTHLDSNRRAIITRPFEQFVSGNAGANGGSCTSGRSSFCTTTAGYNVVDVDGASFTVKTYILDNPNTPQFSQTFTKSGSTLPTPTPSVLPTTSPCPTVSPVLGSVETTVDIPVNGSYRVWSRIMSMSSSSNAYYLQVDNTCPINVGDNSGMADNAWQWVDYQDGDTSLKTTLTLTTGTHMLKLIGKEAQTKLDRVMFILQDSSGNTCIPIDKGDNCTVQPTATPTVVPTLTPTPTVAPNPYDLDQNGVVDTQDYVLFKQYYKEKNTIVDFNQDNNLNVLDFNVFKTAYTNH